MQTDTNHGEEQRRMDRSDSGEKNLKRVCLYIIAEDRAVQRTEEFLNQQLTLIGLINNTPGWRYEKIYMDSARDHTQFDQMIADCEAGRYNIIVTRSFFQFAGTAYHTLKIAGRLAEMDPPVEIIFTEQAIFSLDSEKMGGLKKKYLGKRG